QADIPVIQVSIPMTADARHLMQIGNLLAPLRNQGVLIVGSGGAVHNLGKIVWHGRSSVDARAVKFETWLKRNLIEAKIEDLLNFETEAPELEFAHPTHEHFMPLFFAIGSTLSGDQIRMVHEGFQYGSLSMLTFALS